MRQLSIKKVNQKNSSDLGFVEFEDTRDADDAVKELNGERLCGERVTIEMAHGMPLVLLEHRYLTD